MNRVMLRSVRPLRERNPNRWACSGRREEKEGRLRTCSRAAAPSKPRPEYESVSIARLLFLDSLLDGYECLGHFVHDLGKVRAQQRALGVDDGINRHFAANPVQPDRFPQPTAHAVSLHASAQCLADRKTNPQPLSPGIRLSRSRQIENRHVRSKVPAPLFVNSLKIRVLQQPLALHESLLGCLRSRLRQERLWFLSLGQYFPLRPDSTDPGLLEVDA